MFVVSRIESAGLSLIPTAPLGGLFCGWSFLSNWAQRHKAFQSVMKADRTVVKEASGLRFGVQQARDLSLRILRPDKNNLVVPRAQCPRIPFSLTFRCHLGPNAEQGPGLIPECGIKSSFLLLTHGGQGLPLGKSLNPSEYWWAFLSNVDAHNHSIGLLDTG